MNIRKTSQNNSKPESSISQLFIDKSILLHIQSEDNNEFNPITENIIYDYI